jgi:hypothetical protein
MTTPAHRTAVAVTAPTRTFRHDWRPFNVHTATWLGGAGVVLAVAGHHLVVGG